jgi:hypothetical protein
MKTRMRAAAALTGLMSVRLVSSPAGVRSEYWDRSLIVPPAFLAIGSAACAAAIPKGTFGVRLGIAFTVSLLACALVRVLTFYVIVYWVLAEPLHSLFFTLYSLFLPR